MNFQQAREWIDEKAASLRNRQLEMRKADEGMLKENRDIEIRERKRLAEQIK